MNRAERELRHQKICDGVGEAIAKALDRHRRLGEAIAVWQDGQVVISTGDEIVVPIIKSQHTQGQSSFLED